MIRVDVSGEEGWQFDERRIKRVVERTFGELGVREAGEVEVVIVGEEEMKRMHRKYMETAEVTDVLSWPLAEVANPEFVEYPDGVKRWGQVMVCGPVAKAQAAEKGVEMDQEIDFLVEHGCLHLLGRHHE